MSQFTWLPTSPRIPVKSFVSSAESISVPCAALFARRMRLDIVTFDQEMRISFVFVAS